MTYVVSIHPYERYYLDRKLGGLIAPATPPTTAEPHFHVIIHWLTTQTMVSSGNEIMDFVASATCIRTCNIIMLLMFTLAPRARAP